MTEPRTIDATILDSNTVEAAGKVRRYKQPVYGLACALIPEGHDPKSILVTRWKHGPPAFKPAPLRVFAKWTVEESDRQGLRLRPYREGPWKVGGKTVHGDSGAEAIPGAPRGCLSARPSTGAPSRRVSALPRVGEPTVASIRLSRSEVWSGLNFSES